MKKKLGNKKIYNYTNTISIIILILFIIIMLFSYNIKNPIFNGIIIWSILFIISKWCTNSIVYSLLIAFSFTILICLIKNNPYNNIDESFDNEDKIEDKKEDKDITLEVDNINKEKEKLKENANLTPPNNIDSIKSQLKADSLLKQFDDVKNSFGMQINEFDLKNKSNDFETLNLNDKALIDSLDLDNETDNTFDNNKKQMIIHHIKLKKKHLD